METVNISKGQGPDKTNNRTKEKSKDKKVSYLPKTIQNPLTKEPDFRERVFSRKSKSGSNWAHGPKKEIEKAMEINKEPNKEETEEGMMKLKAQEYIEKVSRRWKRRARMGKEEINSESQPSSEKGNWVLKELKKVGKESGRTLDTSEHTKGYRRTLKP